jgi:hypothetical protein
VLVESGAQLLLLAVLDVFGHMIFLEPAAMPASETTPGGCGPGPLVGHGVEGDDTAAEVYSTYSDRRQDLDMELPMLAGEDQRPVHDPRLQAPQLVPAAVEA